MQKQLEFKRGIWNPLKDQQWLIEIILRKKNFLFSMEWLELLFVYHNYMLLLLHYWSELHKQENTNLRSSVHPQPTHSHPYIFSTSRPNLMLPFVLRHGFFHLNLISNLIISIKKTSNLITIYFFLNFDKIFNVTCVILY